MKNTSKSNLRNSYILSSIMVICFIIFTILVATVDVRPVGEYGSVVGFADFNETFYNMIGFNATMYKISKYLGYIALALVAVWGCVGLMQLIKGKSLKKVDKKLFVLCGLYAAMLVVYVLFEKVVINLRPVIVDAEEGLEASYPSSHTMLSIVVCMSSIVLYNVYIKNKNMRLMATIATVVLMVLIVATRFLSGAHWATDIVGALFASSMLFSLFGLALNVMLSKRKSA